MTMGACACALTARVETTARVKIFFMVGYEKKVEMVNGIQRLVALCVSETGFELDKSSRPLAYYACFFLTNFAIKGKII